MAFDLLIKKLRNTNNIEHKQQEPASDLFIMSTELNNEFARLNHIDKAIFESEREMLDGAEAVDAKKVFDDLEKKHFG